MYLFKQVELLLHCSGPEYHWKSCPMEHFYKNWTQSPHFLAAVISFCTFFNISFFRCPCKNGAIDHLHHHSGANRFRVYCPTDKQRCPLDRRIDVLYHCISSRRLYSSLLLSSLFYFLDSDSVIFVSSYRLLSMVHWDRPGYERHSITYVDQWFDWFCSAYGSICYF